MEFNQCVSDVIKCVIRARHGYNYRWYSADGKYLRKAYYENIRGFDKMPLSTFKHNGNYGIINSQGYVLVSPRFKELRLYATVAKGLDYADEWKYFYFDERGNRSKIKKLVLIKKDDDYDGNADNVVGNPSIVGWFNAGNRGWGLKDPNSGKILITPRYKSVQLIPGTNLSMVSSNLGQPAFPA